MFGERCVTDYAQVIRDLVDRDMIERETSRGIKPGEKLRFVEPPQGNLLSL